MSIITENEIEQIALQYFENLGYKILHGPDISQDMRMQFAIAFEPPLIF